MLKFYGLIKFKIIVDKILNVLYNVFHTMNDEYETKQKEYIMQSITSKNTALNQVASTFKAFNFDNCLILDYGCGKGMSKEFCEKTYNNCKVFMYDPFHGFNETDSFLKQCKESAKNIITCNNVLNVLQDDILQSVIAQVALLANYNRCDIIFKIYEGDKSGNGKISKKDCYQRNEKTENYIPLIIEMFNEYHIIRKGQFIICKHK